MMRLLQEVLELLPESGRQAALRLPSRLVDKIRVRAASTASASFLSILGELAFVITSKPCGQLYVVASRSCKKSAGGIELLSTQTR